jgi:CheY-like chemotaxis protein
VTRIPIVLAVDDDAAVLDSLRMILEYEGMTFHSVGDAASGLRRMRERLYDLLIVDAGMRTTSGVELVGWIRGGATEGDKGSTRRTVPIILWSGGKSATQVREVLPSVEGFLNKPVDPEDLLGMIFRVFPSPRLLPATADFATHHPRMRIGRRGWMTSES